MIISDINYLEATNEEVIGGLSVSKNADIDVTADFDLDFDINLDIDKDVDATLDSTVSITGNFGSSETELTVIGNNGFGEATDVVVITGNLVEITKSVVGAVL